MAPPIRTRPSFSLSQEASISLLSFSIRGQTYWKPQSQKTNRLITWTTALSNSVKPWTMPCRATQDDWFMGEISDKICSTGERNDIPLQHSCLENTMAVWKGKKIGHWKMNSPGRWVPNILLEVSGELTPGRMNKQTQTKNNIQLWMWLVMEVKSDAINSNIA